MFMEASEVMTMIDATNSQVSRTGNLKFHQVIYQKNNMKQCFNWSKPMINSRFTQKPPQHNLPAEVAFQVLL